MATTQVSPAPLPAISPPPRRADSRPRAALFVGRRTLPPARLGVEVPVGVGLLQEPLCVLVQEYVSTLRVRGYAEK